MLWAAPLAAGDQIVARFSSGELSLELGANDFAAATPIRLDPGHGLAFRLTDAAEAAFSEFSEALIGAPLLLEICDRPIVEVIVQDRLSGRGQVSLANRANAERYARVLNGEISC